MTRCGVGGLAACAPQSAGGAAAALTTTSPRATCWTASRRLWAPRNGGTGGTRAAASATRTRSTAPNGNNGSSALRPIPFPLTLPHGAGGARVVAPNPLLPFIGTPCAAASCLCWPAASASLRGGLPHMSAQACKAHPRRRRRLACRPRHRSPLSPRTRHPHLRRRPLRPVQGHPRPRRRRHLPCFRRLRHRLRNSCASRRNTPLAR